jgi:hypothetical protein
MAVVFSTPAEVAIVAFVVATHPVSVVWTSDSVGGVYVVVWPVRVDSSTATVVDSPVLGSVMLTMLIFTPLVLVAFVMFMFVIVVTVEVSVTRVVSVLVPVGTCVVLVIVVLEVEVSLHVAVVDDVLVATSVVDDVLVSVRVTVVLSVSVVVVVEVGVVVVVLVGVFVVVKVSVDVSVGWPTPRVRCRGSFRGSTEWFAGCGVIVRRDPRR